MMSKRALRRNNVVFVMVTMVWLATAVPSSFADINGTATKLSQGDENHQQTSPRISGSNVVWTDVAGLNQNSFDVYLMNLSSQSPLNITSTPNDQEFLADISGNFVVWTHTSSTSSGDIVLYDVTAGTQTTIAAATTSAHFANPAIQGRYIAFEQVTTEEDVVLYDLQLHTLTPVTNSPAAHRKPRVGGDFVVYEDYSTGHSQVYAWRISTSGPAFPISPGPDSQITPDIDTAGNKVIYVQTVAGVDQMFVYDLTTNISTQLTTAASNKVLPRISGSRIVWSDDRHGALDVYLYDLATQTEQLLRGGAGDQFLPSIDGDRVVYVDNSPGYEEVWLFTITPNNVDFSFNEIAPLTVVAGASASTSVTVNPINGFSSGVSLSVAGQPAGVAVSLSPNPITPSGGNSASSVLNVTLPSFLPPTNFSLAVTGASGSLSHSATAAVTTTATTGSTGDSVGDMLNAGCIDNAGIANALTSKLSAAQAAGNVQTAINTLTALKNQIQAQAGKHIHTACNIAGVSFNPVNVLLLDVQGLIDSLRMSLIPDPVSGYVVDVNGAGLAGATVVILNSGAGVVASATTDITGFYFLATTGVLTPGASYTIAVTGLPVGFGAVTPPNQGFTWQGSAMAFSNFILN